MTSKHAGPTMDSLLQRLKEDRPNAAAGLAASTEPSSMDLLNAYGVGLLRLGKIYEALTVFNEIALDSRTLCVKCDVPDRVKRNLATARLMARNPLGCLEVLRMVGDRKNEHCCRLREVVHAWNRSLPFLHRLAWRLGVLPKKMIRLDFIPGELDGDGPDTVVA